MTIVILSQLSYHTVHSCKRAFTIHMSMRK